MTTDLRPAGRPDPARVARMERLAAAVYEPLQRYLRRRTDPETAADVLADSLLVLWQRLDDVPPDGELPWAYGVARRCLANAERSRRRQLRLVDRLAGERAVPAAQPGDGGDERLDAALTRLREDDRELLRLWAWEQLEAREIAAVLGITANAAAIRLHRARNRLAGLLGRPGDAGAGGKSGRPGGQEQGDRAEEVP